MTDQTRAAHGYLIPPGQSAEHKAHHCPFPDWAGLTPAQIKGSVWVCGCGANYEAVLTEHAGMPAWKWISKRRALRLARKAAM